MIEDDRPKLLKQEIEKLKAEKDIYEKANKGRLINLRKSIKGCEKSMKVNEKIHNDIIEVINKHRKEFNANIKLFQNINNKSKVISHENQAIEYKV